MALRRRPISPFSLSFLDIMFCGFGAVVLLVLILNTDTVKARNETFADRRVEVMRLEQGLLLGREKLAQQRPDAKIVKVNIDHSPELAARYRIQSIPAVMSFHQGKVVDQQVGMADLRTLEGMLAN